MILQAAGVRYGNGLISSAFTSEFWKQGQNITFREKNLKSGLGSWALQQAPQVRGTQPTEWKSAGTDIVLEGQTSCHLNRVCNPEVLITAFQALFLLLFPTKASLYSFGILRTSYGNKDIFLKRTPNFQLMSTLKKCPGHRPLTLTLDLKKMCLASLSWRTHLTNEEKSGVFLRVGISKAFHFTIYNIKPVVSFKGFL